MEKVHKTFDLEKLMQQLAIPLTDMEQTADHPDTKCYVILESIFQAQAWMMFKYILITTLNCGK